MPNKPRPANLDTSIEDLTEHGLLYRLLIGIENLFGSTEERNRELIKLPPAVNEFMINKDHGLPHSKMVLTCCRQILEASPRMRLELGSGHLEPMEIDWLFTWTAILHDLARFLGYPSIAEHQLAGANLAKSAFGFEPDRQAMADQLSKMIICHDYICPLVDGKDLPIIIKTNPLVEIFRLADKISLSPAEELYRYYLTGKRYGGDFYRRMPFSQRIDFPHNYDQRDWLTFFLIIFAIQPNDFYRPEAQAIYRQWAQGKSAAAAKIIELARQEKLADSTIEEIIQVVRNFHHYMEQPDPF